MRKSTYAISLLCLIAGITYGQKTKNIDVYSNQTVIVSGTVTYAEDNKTPLDTTYYIFGKDHRYPSLNDLITLHRGSLTKILGFSKTVMESFNEDDGVTITHDENRISTLKTSMGTYVIVYGMGNDEDGYTQFIKSQTTKLVKKLEDYKLHGKL